MRIWQVDAFTSEPFKGNPAAVCALDGPGEDAWMQAVAIEMNLSETAFFWPHGDADNYGLRWFTLASEVPLCGHATLATAHVIWSELGANTEEPLGYQTQSGELVAQRTGQGIELDFPIQQLKRLRGVDRPARLSTAARFDLLERYEDDRRYLVELPEGWLVR